MQSPGPLFVDEVANLLRSYWESRRNPASTDQAVRCGMYLGDQPPITPEVYRSRCEELLPTFVPNSWENFADIALVISSSVATFSQYYKAAYRSPLASGASPEVTAWWTAARAAAGIV